MKRGFPPILAQLQRDDCFIMSIGPFGPPSFILIAIPSTRRPPTAAGERSPLQPVLFDPQHLSLKLSVGAGASLTFVLQSTATTAACPLCGQSSARPHSHYVRRLADLPCHDWPVRLQVEVRRFFCANADCRRRIFAERLPAVAAVHARTTVRLDKAHCNIGLALGGEAGARLAARLAMPTSADTLLRRIRRAPLPRHPAVRVLGVDDWAWRKGRSYGTILCDLQRGRPIDLLPDREAATLTTWLKDHPGVEVISRDRAGAYAQAAREGAPQARQVADRWHLLKNIREMLEGLLGRRRGRLQAAAQAAATVGSTGQDLGIAAPTPALGPTPVTPPRLSRKEAARATSRERRRERYDAVLAFHRQGYSDREIARRLHLSRITVQRYRRGPGFPERCASPRRPSRLDPYGDEVRRRWEGGCRNAAQISRELIAAGYPVSYGMVRQRVQEYRAAERGRPPPVKPPSPRRASWLLLGGGWGVTAEGQGFVEVLCQQNEEIRQAAELAREFAGMLRRERAAALEGWLVRAEADGIPAELRGFANTLRQDQAAVEAALQEPWSNGPVEGCINRLKTTKRQMYGRANFDLLRLRVLHGA
jgi:transposase